MYIINCLLTVVKQFIKEMHSKPNLFQFKYLKNCQIAAFSS